MPIAGPNKGESNVKFHSLRTSLVSLVLAFLAAALVAGCGGGGAAGNPAANPVLQITPATGSLYAGVPATFQIMGGRRPYALSSSEPGLLPVPSQIDSNSFEVVPNNPGVIDSGLKPEDLPVRTVNITVRSGDGQTVTSVVKVGINFLTSYNVVYTTSICPTTGPTAGAQVCAGGETLVSLFAVFNGNILAGRQYRFEVVRGTFTLTNPDTGASGQSVVVTTDNGGTARAVIRVPLGVTSQIGILRVVDVATGVYEDHAFSIAGNGPSGTLTPIPSTVTFKGNFTTDCGVGQADIYVFDGVTPYFATSSNPAISVTPQSGTNPGRITVSASSINPPCPSATVIITDGAGSRGTVTVTSTPGSVTPPAPPEPPVSITPSSITLACGGSGSVSVIGGSGTYSASSANSAITALISGNTLTVTRVNSGTVPVPATVFVTDGATIASLSVTSPATCP